MQRGGVNHAVVMSLSWRQEPPALYNYQRWQGGDEGRKGQRKMTRGSNKLNSPLQVGAIYTRAVLGGWMEHAKLPGRSFMR